MLARHHFVNQYKLNKYAIGKPILINAFCYLNCSYYTNYTSKQFNESNYNQSSEAPQPLLTVTPLGLVLPGGHTVAENILRNGQRKLCDENTP